MYCVLLGDLCTREVMVGNPRPSATMGQLPPALPESIGSSYLKILLTQIPTTMKTKLFITCPEEQATMIIESALRHHPDSSYVVLTKFYSLARLGKPIVTCAKEACKEIRAGLYQGVDPLAQRAIDDLWGFNHSVKSQHMDVMLWLRPDLAEEYLPF